MAHAEELVDDPAGPYLSSGIVGVVVAHPDDEVLWAGGTILTHPCATWRIFTLCRAGDPDRAPRFHHALDALGASGTIADLDDGPHQEPLAKAELQKTVLTLVGDALYEVLITHGPRGEYTRNVRHEEISETVGRLWVDGRIKSREMWMFAYEDGGGTRLPEAIRSAHVKFPLRAGVVQEKRHLVVDVYGFSPESWEARTTPCWEAFWRFEKPADYVRWLKRQKEHK